MQSVRDTRVFNRSERLIEGWYWALPSKALKKGEVKPLNLCGRELVLFRGDDGQVACLDAYCPHMGAHLAEGWVEGDALRCFFHAWKFDRSGTCVDIPCRAKPVQAGVKRWPTAEKYGLIWVWTGETARQPVPFVPELEHAEVDAKLGNRFEKGCHPNVVMINAIDAQHFNSVHNLPVHLVMEPRVMHENAIQFSNTTRVPSGSALTRFIGRFYAGPLTYSMCYWFGATGSVTLGPDFLHFHIIFALRPTQDGKTEGQTILVTKKRSGFWGRAVNRVLLALTKVVGDYFAKGDTLVFQTIKFSLDTPIREDLAIVRFIQHAERQRSITYATWTDGSAELPVLDVLPPFEVVGGDS